MSRFHSYINTAVSIVNAYTGEIPFSLFIKQFFASNKKYGSKDRKVISNICYNYFRLGHSVEASPQEKCMIGWFICEDESSEFLDKLKPEWNQQIHLPVAKKWEIVAERQVVLPVFKYSDRLSQGIDAASFSNSFLIQPGLYLRLRPGFKISNLTKLIKSGIFYHLISEDCLELPMNTNVEDFFKIDKEVVIQDFNSQNVLNYLKKNLSEIMQQLTQGREVVSVWDCCAASGGKSILLYDILQKKLELTISDIRPSIILNLHQRFNRAGIKEYQYFIADIGGPDFVPPGNQFDIILTDVPCTGSGTWSRVPEQLSFFNVNAIQEYAEKQKRIVKNVVPHLKAGGYLFYITCSVFKDENEGIAAYMQDELSLELQYMQCLPGYEQQADSMFVAVLRKLN